MGTDPLTSAVMKINRLFLVAFLLCSFAQGPLAQHPSLDEIAAIRKRCNKDEPCMLREAWKWMTFGDCVEAEGAACVILTLNPRAIQDREGDFPTCEQEFPLYHHLMGAAYYSASLWEPAIDHFIQSGRESMQPLGVAEANIGACYFEMNELGHAVACFEESWDLVDKDETESMFMILNNLAAVNLKFQRPKEALIWIALAAENLAQLRGKELASSLPKSFIDEADQIIRTNDFAAHLQLDDLPFLQTHWRELNWGAGNRNESWINLILETSQKLSSEEFMSAQARNLFSLISEIDPDTPSWDQQLSVHSTLIHWVHTGGEDLNTFIDLWKALNDLKAFGTKSASLNGSASTDFDFGMLIWGSLTGILAVLFTAQLLKRSALQKLNRMNAKELMKVIEDWRDGAATQVQAVTALRHLSRLSVSNRNQPRMDLNLSEAESLVLQSIQLGEAPKDLARRTGWSTKYVYSLRSQLRAALNIPKSASLDDWINEPENQPKR